MDRFLKWPATLWAAFIAVGLAVSLWIARAPTSHTDKLPIIGDNLPIKLNAVYFIVAAPALAAFCAGVLWLFISNAKGVGLPPMLLRDRQREAILLYCVSAAVFALSIVLSAQYFLILAPEALCSSRPHFEFLWTNVSSAGRIFHCMSGTDEINRQAPYYWEPQILQSWAQALYPALTLVLLIGASRAWTRSASIAERS